MSTLAIIDYGSGQVTWGGGKAIEHVAPGGVSESNLHAADSGGRSCFAAGVRAIRDCMGEIRRLGFDQVVKPLRIPVNPSGICVGIRRPGDGRQRGNGGVDCLGMFAGQV